MIPPQQALSFVLDRTCYGVLVCLPHVGWIICHGGLRLACLHTGNEEERLESRECIGT
jgi:hypothetical protein